MNFLTSWRNKLSGAIAHHPTLRQSSLFGELEELDDGLWRTTTPVEFIHGLEPIGVTIDTDARDAKGRPTDGGEIFTELRAQYADLRREIGGMLCKATPKAHAIGLWERVTLGNIAIWREPETAKPVVALEYFLNESPEYVYTIRLEADEQATGGRHWRAVDVIVSG
jgi:hypothetical protein